MRKLIDTRLTDQLGMVNDEPIYKETVNGVRYYAHPFYGNSVPLIIKYNGAWYYSRNYLIQV